MLKLNLQMTVLRGEALSEVSELSHEGPILVNGNSALINEDEGRLEM